MVIALAGRRVDAPKVGTVCFPLANVPQVRKRISDWFAQHTVHTLVCSAASGVDLLALDVSEELGIDRCIVLPFPREQFRGTSVVDRSVVDRSDDWGKRFDEILNVVEAQGNVFVLGYAPENETAYLATNHTILELAISISTRLNRRVGAVVVWDGTSRGDDDVTAAFQQEAHGRGLAVDELSTL